MLIVNKPLPDGLPGVITTALENLRNGSTQIRQVIDTYRATVAEQVTAVSHDPNLTEQGRDARVQEIRRQAGEQAATDLQRVREALDSDHETVLQYLQRKWPAPASGVEALLSRQAAWARMRSLLEAGMGPQNLIEETTDIESLWALREELPTWQRANAGRMNDRGGSTEMIDRRIADLTGDFASAALDAAIDSDACRAYCEPLLNHAANEVRGLVDRSAALAAAIAAEQARQKVIAAGGAGDTSGA
jgi:hypothetical protein